ncbi:hypothetical protein EHS13_15670 [Paenibacillus psychroresistens]|uniref:Cohesin domain-containing protein n=1 Tax=Paenibacillus psychroresistens TaxID=1778678 RepID=A0A6B8RKZ1_9BACL|nr:cohesin domain-containing protein [Paenibacillus psychroresistens]QGQ96213.1 hypothetical protein EHS13_15670 [Paenibacillus psychroresistens]
MNKFLTRLSSLMVILALALLLIPQVHAAPPAGDITFGTMFTPRPNLTDGSGIILVPRSFEFAVQITSTKVISKVTVKVENFTAKMDFSTDASCHYCAGYITKIELGAKSQNGLKKLVVKATDINGYSTTHDYYVTLGDPDHPLPSIELTSNVNVFSGKSFDIIYKLRNASLPIFGQEILLNYDPLKVEFVSAKSMQQNVKILNKNTLYDGVVILKVGRMDITKNTDSLSLIKFQFKAKKLNASSTTTMYSIVSVLDDKGVKLNQLTGTDNFSTINIIKK